MRAGAASDAPRRDGRRRGAALVLVWTSRGAELALLLGATLPQVGAVIAYAPGGVLRGEDGQMWPSALMAERIMRRLADHRFAWPYRHLRYPDAGHLIGPLWQPTTGNTRRHPTVGATFPYGGAPAGQAHANANSWRHALEWLCAHMA